MPPLSALSNEEILAIAEPLIQNMIAGTVEIDYEKHTRDFTEDLKGYVTKDAFEEQVALLQNELGHFSEKKFVEIFRKKEKVSIIWKQSLSKTEDEFMNELTLIEQDGHYRVANTFLY